MSLMEVALAKMARYCWRLACRLVIRDCRSTYLPVTSVALVVRLRLFPRTCASCSTAPKPASGTSNVTLPWGDVPPAPGLALVWVLATKPCALVASVVKAVMVDVRAPLGTCRSSEPVCAILVDWPAGEVDWGAAPLGAERLGFDCGVRWTGLNDRDGPPAFGVAVDRCDPTATEEVGCDPVVGRRASPTPAIPANTIRPAATASSRWERRVPGPLRRLGGGSSVSAAGVTAPSSRLPSSLPSELPSSVPRARSTMSLAPESGTSKAAPASPNGAPRRWAG